MSKTTVTIRRTKERYATAPVPVPQPTEHITQFPEFVAIIQRNMDRAAKAGPIFVTDAPNIAENYLAAIPHSTQYHNCNCCRGFLNRYGKLGRIDEQGRLVSALFPTPADFPSFYQDPARVINALVTQANITSVFVSDKPVLGEPVTNGWDHIFVNNPNVYQNKLYTPYQKQARYQSAFEMTSRALTKFKINHIENALQLLKLNTFNSSEDYVAPMQWFCDLHKATSSVHKKMRALKIWSAVASAPEGFAHISNSVTGKLLEDLTAGVDLPLIKERFNQMVSGINYKRPKAPPKAGNIERAENIVATLGIANSLKRRFAQLKEIPTIWTPPTISKPKAATSKAGSVFAHLNTPVNEPANRMALEMNSKDTLIWVKFAATILPQAHKLRIYIKSGNLPFVAYTTAQDMKAPPIIKWDKPEARNPFAYYLYHNGSPASQWGLETNQWHDIKAISNFPDTWNNPAANNGVLLVIPSCFDNNKGQGNALFPSFLKDELFEVRSTIEQYSKKAELGKRIIGQKACGLGIWSGPKFNYIVEVVVHNIRTQYTIDRWD